jgi:inositol transport system permease protein
MPPLINVGKFSMSAIINSQQPVIKTANGIQWIAILEKFGVMLFLGVLIMFFELQNERFLSVRNIFNILSDVSIYGILSVGMTFVILSAGIDLSVGRFWRSVRCVERSWSRVGRR